MSQPLAGRLVGKEWVVVIRGGFFYPSNEMTCDRCHQLREAPSEFGKRLKPVLGKGLGCGKTQRSSMFPGLFHNSLSLN